MCKRTEEDDNIYIEADNNLGEEVTHSLGELRDSNFKISSIKAMERIKKLLQL